MGKTRRDAAVDVWQNKRDGAPDNSDFRHPTFAPLWTSSHQKYSIDATHRGL